MTLNLHTVPSSESPPPRIGNRLLADLPEDDLEHLGGLCELVDLEAGDILFEAGQPIDYIYFPLDTLISRKPTSRAISATTCSCTPER